MSFSYANPTSGPSAGGIGWFNFGNLTLNPGDVVTGLTGTLNDGSTVTFDISAQNTAGAARSFTAVPTPTWGGTFFGTTNYTGILGNVAMKKNLVFAPGINDITLSNIVVKDSLGNPITNYTAIISDAESTGLGERWTWTTTGGNWDLFATLGNSTSPTLTGLGTQTASFIGNAPVDHNDLVLSTQSPTNLILSSEALNFSGGEQAIAIGFAVTKITVQKNVGQRINPADQFVLDIAGTPSAQATTTGAADGIQTQTAVVYATAGNSYTINEAMAPGSVSTLSQYTVVTSAANSTPAGSIPPVGALPITFTPALGDDVTYTILNAAPHTFSKSVNKAYADIGDVLTYTVTVNNPNNIAISNVLVTDATPAGTTYIGNLVVSAPFTGTDPASGITVTSIGANSAVTLTWQVQVNTISPIPNPIVNLANVVIPGFNSGVTNVVETQIAHAFVSAIKTVDKVNANVGEILTYTITATNFGNVPANNVVLTDPIPAGTTYVAGSVVGSVPFTGTPVTSIVLTAPIPVGGNAVFTYQVKVGNSIPNPNPIPNTAGVAYAYTVDPAKPNGVTASGTSNTVTTQVSAATLKIAKQVDKAISYIDDVITYQVAVTNTGNVPANSVVLTDPVPNGTTYVAGSLASNVAFSGSPLTTIQLLNPIAPGETVALSYQVKVTAIPNPNPVINIMTAAFTYTVNPLDPDGVTGNSISNAVKTVIFRNDFSQEISDLIHSIALEEAAIGNIIDAEGAKIQKLLAMGASTNELLCVNKSVADMLESLATLESVFKQKLSAVDCQINPSCL